MTDFGMASCLRRTRKICFLLVLLVLGLGAAVPAHAQLSVYVDYNAIQLHDFATSRSLTLFGPSVGATYNLADKGKASLGFDFRGGFAAENDSSGARFSTLMIGPQVSTHIKKRFKPYGEFLVGFGRYNDGLGTPSSKTTDMDVSLNAGLDMQMTKHLDWRIFEYGWSKYLGLGGELNPRTYTGGIVMHF